MKFALALIAAVVGQDQAPDDEWIGPNYVAEVPAFGIQPRGRMGGTRVVQQTRRYDDLDQIAVKYWRKAGLIGKDKFKDEKYWAYGCHCFLLGDRPMSSMGKGKPVDPLDNICKKYKDCQKCVRDKHGDQCIGEFIRYTWRYATQRQRFECSDNSGTCERELFECDLQFVKDTFAQKEAYSDSHHAFYGGFDNEDPNNCVIGMNPPQPHQCCGGGNGPYFWINTNNYQCINDQVVEA